MGADWMWMGLRALPGMPVRAAVRQLSVPVAPVPAAHPLQQQLSSCMHIVALRHTQSVAGMFAVDHMLISSPVPLARSMRNLFFGILYPCLVQNPSLPAELR